MGQGNSTPPNSGTIENNFSTEQWPLVYCNGYNIRLMGLEKFSKFDVLKSERTSKILVDRKILPSGCYAEPHEALDEELQKVHTGEYLRSLKEKSTVKDITGISLLSIMPYSFTENSILKPFRFQASGTILAGKLAMDHGWAINLGGGQHHCSTTHATPGGFSLYADITMNIKHVQNNFPSIQKVLIIDLDVHQGNGYAHDFMNDDSVYIFDVYNCTIFPNDDVAKKAIRCKVELQSGVEDEEYLDHVKRHIDSVLDNFQPHYVVYNAGVDILQGDSLGQLKVTPDGVIKRDSIVFAAVRARHIPIVMLLSGGFSRNAASVVADSITNLHKVGLIEGPKTNITN